MKKKQFIRHSSKNNFSVQIYSQNRGIYDLSCTLSDVKVVEYTISKFSSVSFQKKEFIKGLEMEKIDLAGLSDETLFFHNKTLGLTGLEFNASTHTCNFN